MNEAQPGGEIAAKAREAGEDRCPSIARTAPAVRRGARSCLDFKWVAAPLRRRKAVRQHRATKIGRSRGALTSAFGNGSPIASLDPISYAAIPGPRAVARRDRPVVHSDRAPDPNSRAVSPDPCPVLRPLPGPRHGLALRGQPPAARGGQTRDAQIQGGLRGGRRRSRPVQRRSHRRGPAVKARIQHHEPRSLTCLDGRVIAAENPQRSTNNESPINNL